MVENREEYELKTRNELINKLKLDLDKEYQINEIEELIEKHNLNNGILQFVPRKPHTGQMIIDTLVYMNMRVADAIHKELGVYEDKSKCDDCENYYDAEKDRMFQVEEEKSPFICETCRRKRHLKIRYYDFIKCFSDEDRKIFILEESKYGLDYADYIKRLTRTN